ncbi:MAG: hypothetical protein U5J64_07170 [Halobacteriales archaeon]|nr:hypothetical protein [Halobacteriales archaeon]
MSKNRRILVEEHYDKLSHLGGPQTPIRVAVLEEISSNGSLSKRELRDIFVEGKGKDWGFEVSKPTLYRQLDDDPENTTGDTLSLVERGWIEDVSESRNAEARYAITPKGRILYDEVTSLFELFDLMDDIQPELEPFLEVVTKADVEMGKDVLEELINAEIYPTTATNQFAMQSYQEYIDFISEVDRILGITWVWSQMFLDSYYNFLVEEDKEVEFILTPEVTETLVESHTEKWREMLETGNLTVIECDIFPFGITIVEKGVAWGYFEPEKGAHEYELMTESEVVRDWAIEIFEEYKQEGRNVTEEQLEKTTQETTSAERGA